MLIGKIVRLEPNKEQEQAFLCFVGGNRFAWNESKSYVDTLYRNEKRYKTA